MAVAAETQTKTVYEPFAHEAAAFADIEAEPAQDVDFRLAALDHEAAIKAQKLIRSVGRTALEHEVVHSEMTLYDAILMGNRPLVTENVRTDVIERTFKAGHVMKITQSIDARGNITQHRQTSEQIQANTLRYANASPIIKPRTAAETKNMYYIDSLRRKGLLEDNYAVVVSLCPDADDETLDRLGFFAFSKSLVIQATTEEAGHVTTESAFIAGVKQDGAQRYDREVAVRFGATFGEDWRGLDEAGIISRVLLVPKTVTPQGAIDLVERWDNLAGGTFFGQAKPRQDYAEYLKQCRQREKDFGPTVDAIVTDLMTLAPALRNPVDATKALDKISEKHTLEQALVDRTVDARVFGAKAAVDLEVARFHLDRGNLEQVSIAMGSARKNAQSGSCASGALERGKGSIYNEDGTLKTPEQLDKERDQEDDASDEHGALTFYCTEGHRNTRKRGELLTVCQTKPCKPGSVGCEPDSAADHSASEKRASSTDVFVKEMRKLFRTNQPKPASVPKQPLAQANVVLAA